ncbi:type IV pilus assembly protein FimV [Variovorax ureilyticus]|uniref:type IV pilus assembly protein FimV n=1 Tax=Variovorax ureilyticus TaxID=1836198 RepID=UPI003D67839A
MTIGRPQGAVWIGKPIDVVIPLALDAAEAGSSLCLGAEVLQGDAPMLERRVTVSLESGSSPGNSNIRVRTTVPVDEPVVTITVRAGCDMKSTRNYVLLADVPSDLTPPGVAVAGARPSADGAPVPRPTARPTSRMAGGGGGGAASQDGSGSSTVRRAAARSSAERESTAQAASQASAPAAPAPRRAAPIVPRAVPAARPTAAAPPKTEPVAAGPRLQVDALEPEPAKESGLKTTPRSCLRPPRIPRAVRRPLRCGAQ